MPVEGRRRAWRADLGGDKTRDFRATVTGSLLSSLPITGLSLPVSIRSAQARIPPFLNFLTGNVHNRDGLNFSPPISPAEIRAPWICRTESSDP